MKRNLIAIAISTALLFTTACGSNENKNSESSSNSGAQQANSSHKLANAASMSALESQARAKLAVLEDMMNKAREQKIDVAREETIVWFSEQFLKFSLNPISRLPIFIASIVLFDCSNTSSTFCKLLFVFS